MGNGTRFELLLERIKKHKNLQSLVEETSNLPATELVNSLLREFEQVVERYRSLSAFAGRARELASAKAHAEPFVLHLHRSQSPEDRIPDQKKTSAGQGEPQPLSVKPIKIVLPRIDVQSAERALVAKRAEEERNARLRQELEKVDRVIHDEIEKDWNAKTQGFRGRVSQLRASQQAMNHERESKQQEELEQKPSISKDELHQPEISDEDVIYLHAISFDTEACKEEQTKVVSDILGIDEKNFLLIVEQAEVRCYVSKLNQDYSRVTKSGVLLLSKEESIKLRALHEEILNRLRCRETVTAFEVGTVVLGKEELARRIAAASEMFRFGLDRDGHATVWTLKLHALDSLVTTVVAGQQSTAKVQQRGREARRPAKRSDIKVLERVLQHEQKTAEAIHAMLSACSSSAEIQSRVSIANGVSEDWKIILQATYHVTAPDRSQFLLKILDLQEKHRDGGLMFEVRGASEQPSLSAESVTPHSISA
jgi:hypothetical protein